MRYEGLGQHCQSAAFIFEQTDFDPDCDVKNEPHKHFLARQLAPDINFEFAETFKENKRVVVLTIPAAKIVPTAFKNERYHGKKCFSR